MLQFAKVFHAKKTLLFTRKVSLTFYHFSQIFHHHHHHHLNNQWCQVVIILLSLHLHHPLIMYLNRLHLINNPFLPHNHLLFTRDSNK